MANHKKRKQKKAPSFWKRLLICLLICMLTAVAAVAVVFKGKLGLIQRGEIEGTGSLGATSENLQFESGVEVELGGKVVIPDGEILKDDNVTNILLIGTDERSEEYSSEARGDSIMILSLNSKENSIKLVSLERALAVQIPGQEDDWLTHAFHYGGTKLLIDIMHTHFKLDVDRYVRVNFYNFSQAIDVLGGVDITFTEAEAAYFNKEYKNGNPEFTAGSGYPFQVGVNHLDGTSALNYARLRAIDDDFGRVQRQRNVIQAAINEVGDASMAQIMALADELLPMVQTNLTDGEIAALLLKAPGFLGATMDQMTIPQKGTYWSRYTSTGQALMACDYKQVSKQLKAFLYGEDAVDDDDDNGSYVTFSSQNRVISRPSSSSQVASSKGGSPSSSGIIVDNGD